jgi:hypothetical protein
MAGGESSFSKQVLSRAWFAAWGFFDSWKRDLVLFAASLVVGGGYYLQDHGWPKDVWGAMDAIIHAAAPAVIIWLGLFLWHLWLAPSALAYQAAKEAISEAHAARPAAPRPVKPEKGINWAVWKQRSTYTLIEFAAILAKADPGSNLENSEQKSFSKLLIEDAMGRKLPVQRGRNAEDWYSPDIYPTYFIITRGDALKWAEAKGFDVSHIR